jgi:hypothetical protein
VDVLFVVQGCTSQLNMWTFLPENFWIFKLREIKCITVQVLSPNKFSSFCFLSFLLSRLYTISKRLWTCNKIPKEFWKIFKSGLWHSDQEMTNVSRNLVTTIGSFCFPDNMAIGDLLILLLLSKVEKWINKWVTVGVKKQSQCLELQIIPFRSLIFNCFMLKMGVCNQVNPIQKSTSQKLPHNWVTEEEFKD